MGLKQSAVESAVEGAFVVVDSEINKTRKEKKLTSSKQIGHLSSDSPGLAHSPYVPDGKPLITFCGVCRGWTSPRIESR